MMRRLALALTLFTGLALGEPASLSSKLEGVEDLRKFFGIGSEYVKIDSLKDVKIAILDRGFEGMAEGEGPGAGDRVYLPRKTRTLTKYDGEEGQPLLAEDSQGRRLAQLIWAMTGFHDEGPQFRLYNANGLVNFRNAVRDAMAWPADIILNTVNFESFGEFDGTGPVNKLVDEAARAISLWIQSPGEYAKKAYEGPIKFNEERSKTERWVYIDKSSYYARFQVNADDTDVVVTASWNAFSRSRRFHGTNKDLDLFVWGPSFDPLKPTAKPLAKSEGRQVEAEPSKEGETNLATERLELNLMANDKPYYIGLKYFGGDFNPDTDRVRITVTSNKKPFFDAEAKKDIDPLEFLDATEKCGCLMIPSDNRFGITIGDWSPRCPPGPTVDNRAKPELFLDKSEAYFSDKGALGGPHVAAAEFAAFTVLLKAKAPALQRKHLLLLIADRKAKADAAGKAETDPAKKRSIRWLMPTPSELDQLIKDNP